MLFPSHVRRGDPFTLMRSMMPMMRGVDRDYSPTSSPAVFPAINVWQGDEAVAVTAELPGVSPSDIVITVKDSVLTLSGERAVPDVPEDARWHRNERTFGKFSRSIRLPFQASDERVEARFQNGVLRIIIGRPEEDRPRKIEIKAA